MPTKSRTAELTLSVSFPRHGSAGPAAGSVHDIVELAATKLMRGMLRDGESSVAVDTELNYAAPDVAAACAPGSRLRAVAQLEEAAGRAHRFTVHVFDATGLIAIASHSRATVTPRAGARDATRLAV